jgi:hypothetical protein
MTHTDWHVSDTLLHRFVEDPAGIDDVTASSVEAHLVACGDCRALLREHAAPASSQHSWDAIADRIDRPRLLLGERLLQLLGVQGSVARLLAVTPALRVAGLLAVVVVAAAAAAVSRSADAEGPFLLLAPLAPLAMVGLSFAPTGDPAAETGMATPLHGFGLMVRRTVAILLVTFGALGVATLAAPGLGLEAAGWVLPALALTIGSLCLATWLRIEVAVVLLAVAWVAVVVSLRWAAGHGVTYAASPAFSLAGQLTAGAVAMVAASLLVVRRDRFATLEVLR